MNTFQKTAENPAGEIKALYVGIDVAKRKHCARGLAGSRSKPTSATFFNNDRKGFEWFLASLTNFVKYSTIND